MKTKFITISDMKINNMTKYGRKRNEVISHFMDNGCKVIKERKESCNSRVYLGYINEYVPFANFSARVCRNGDVTIKKSDCVHSPIPSSVRLFKIFKSFMDKKGNVEITKVSRKILDGKILENYSETRRYENT